MAFARATADREKSPAGGPALPAFDAYRLAHRPRAGYQPPNRPQMAVAASDGENDAPEDFATVRGAARRHVSRSRNLYCCGAKS